ncbi:MAG: hypothetical protein WBY44_28280, partial [Bryobacteraceae bacterium]
MLLVNAPRPAAGQLVPQRRRLTDASERIALRVAYETDDANRLNRFLFCPSCQIVKRFRVEFDASHKP